MHLRGFVSKRCLRANKVVVAVVAVVTGAGAGALSSLTVHIRSLMSDLCVGISYEQRNIYCPEMVFHHEAKIY